MTSSAERWKLRRDRKGRLLYFPFGLVGRGYEVGDEAEFAWLRSQERARRFGYFAVYFAGVFANEIFDLAMARFLVLAGLVLAYEIVTGVYLVRSTTSRRTLAVQPSGLERAAEASDTTIGWAFASMMVWSLLLVALGALAFVDLAAPALGAILIGVAVVSSARSTVDFARHRRSSRALQS
jgi:hypothetical protein